MSDFAKWQIGDLVRKKRGSSWRGRVVGFYSTEHTLHGYNIESLFEPGSVQCWPEAALEDWDGTTPPVTVTNEAGLVEGFKQGIEAAAKVADHRRDLIFDGLTTPAAMAVVDAMPDAIRALSPPSIADDGKEGAG